ncbi:retropepsin-like aspartic protease family protein [Silvimonas soli]|uniref:retropepsin-like aspartic protease family protein n=1 Tax=Silvimonas soli TaxID=2980100 RepID=UPI0024B3935B|nr:retropepsin-like aspartic protease [Silvimonas soli]
MIATLARWLLVGVCSFWLALNANAQSLTFMAAMGNKAMLTIDGQRVLLAVGQTTQNVRLVQLTEDSATVQINGKTRQLKLGEGYQAADRGNTTLILRPDERGQYYTTVHVGAVSVRAIVDTGASHLTLSRTMADQMKINYRSGQMTTSMTANGNAHTWLVTVPEITLDNITLNNVPAAVLDGDDPKFALIGMSVMSQFDVKRENSLMVLTRTH